MEKITLSAYLDKSKKDPFEIRKQAIGSVILQKGEYEHFKLGLYRYVTLDIPSILFRHTYILHQESYEDPQSEFITLWTTDEHGNHKSRSCFSVSRNDIFLGSTK